MKQQTSDRLLGLDLARYVALIGMVIVNFNVVLVPTGSAYETGSLASFLQGRAAATFVVLAGLGFGLGSAQASWRSASLITLKRSVFLLALGMLNCLIFEADIVHYYAVYFLFCLLFIKVPNWLLSAAIAALAAVHLLALIWLDYDRGWNWQDLEYLDFWSINGFTRNLFFNGWHPVVPWLGFALFGLLLSRLNLRSLRVATTLALTGALVLALTEWVSNALIKLVENSNLSAADREVATLLDTLPVPPTPLYLVAGMSAASLTTGICLLIMHAAPHNRALRIFTTTGRHTLTLYLAHIILGMGTLQALGLIGTADSTTAMLATIVFCCAATVFSMVWGRSHRLGPLEWLMHRMTRGT